MYRALLCILLLLCTAACRRDQPPLHSFYYWKTGSSGKDDSLRAGMGVNHFYVHYFDVEWSESRHMAVPAGELHKYYFDDYPFADLPITPVVFITNRTLLRMPAGDIDSLAARMTDKVASITAILDEEWVTRAFYSLKLPYAYGGRDDSIRAGLRAIRSKQHPDIQIDCDWTAITRDAYFTLLKRLRARMPGKIFSATIRLYPYKYRSRMGVPPVDRGMLMCYNLGRISDPATANSVFKLEELKQYLDVPEYPLPLDYALPVFGWAAWFRGNNFKGIIHEVDTAQWLTRYGFRRRDATHFVASADAVMGADYFREGDELRLEYPDAGELKKAAQLLAQKIPHPQHIALYHWDAKAAAQYEDVIDTVFRR